MRAQAVLAGAAVGGRCVAGCGCPGSVDGAGLSHGAPSGLHSAGRRTEPIAPRPPTGAAEAGCRGESCSGGRAGTGERVPGGQRGAHRRHRKAPSAGEPGFGGGAGAPVRHRPGAPAGRHLSAHGQRLSLSLPAAGLRPGEKAQPDPGGHRPTGHRHRSGGAERFGVGALPSDAPGRGWLVRGVHPVPGAAGLPVDQLLAGQLVGWGAALFAADGDFEKRHRLCGDQGGAPALPLPHGAKRGRAGGGQDALRHRVPAHRCRVRPGAGTKAGALPPRQPTGGGKPPLRPAGRPAGQRQARGSGTAAVGGQRPGGHQSVERTIRRRLLPLFPLAHLLGFRRPLHGLGAETGGTAGAGTVLAFRPQRIAAAGRRPGRPAGHQVHPDSGQRHHLKYQRRQTYDRHHAPPHEPPQDRPKAEGRHPGVRHFAAPDSGEPDGERQDPFRPGAGRAGRH